MLEISQAKQLKELKRENARYRPAHGYKKNGRTILLKSKELLFLMLQGSILVNGLTSLARRLIGAPSQIGYKLEDSISDLVDNSISAHAKKVLIRFLHDGENITQILVADDGVGMRSSALKDSMRFGPDDWSRDGSKIAVVNFPTNSGYLDLDTTPIDFKELTSSQGSSIFGLKFSPNGKWISFSSSIAGGYNCYIAPFDKPNNAYLVSNIYQGEEPIWSPAGDEIFYRATQGMYSVALSFDENDEVDIGKAKLLFDTPWIDNPGIGHTIHPKGDKFLVIVPEKEEISDHFKIVFNFDALIEQKFAKQENNTKIER